MKEQIVVLYVSKGKELELRLNVEGSSWDSTLQSMINFLRGVGYVIPEEIDIV